jgi:hypothetical protein
MAQQGTVNICSPQYVSVKELVGTVVEVAKKKIYLLFLFQI